MKLADLFEALDDKRPRPEGDVQVLGWLKRYGYDSHCTVKDGRVNSDKTVDLRALRLRTDLKSGLAKKLPRFGTVKGLEAGDLNLGTLRGWAPHEVLDDFTVRGNGLQSLKDGPLIVGGSLDVADNKLTSFKYAPGGRVENILASGNKISSFEGLPPEIIGNLDIRNNEFTSLKDVKRLDGLIFIHGNEIKSHVLRLFLTGAKGISYNSNEASQRAWGEIVKRHLKQGKDGLIDCQHELIEKGLEEYAQL